MTASPRVPSSFSPEVVSAMQQGDGFQTACALARQGFKVLPVNTIDPGGRCSCGNLNCSSPGKHPYWPVAPHGFRDATNDVEKVRHWFGLFDPLNIGLALGDGIIALDLDPRAGVDLDDMYGLPPTNTELTGGGGQHRFYREPKGIGLRTTVLPSGAEVKAAKSYVVIAPGIHASGRRYFNPDPARRIARIPTDWAYLAQGAFSRPDLARIAGFDEPNEIHQRMARQIWTELQGGPFRDTMMHLYFGRWWQPVNELGGKRYASRSSADLGLLVAATWYTTDPIVLDAVLRASKLARPKWNDRPEYRAVQIATALDWRMRRNADRLGVIREACGQITPQISAVGPGDDTDCSAGCTAPTPTPIPMETVLVGTLRFHYPPRNTNRMRLITQIVCFAHNAPKCFQRPGGWIRFPVCDFAIIAGVSRRTVQRAIDDAYDRGLIATYYKAIYLNGDTRKDRLIRPIPLPETGDKENE